MYCPKCSKWYPFSVTEESIKCGKCTDVILQPDIVLYGDNIPRLQDSINLVSNVDLLLVIGTSFYTSTATYVSEAAKSAGVKVEIINENAEELIPKFLNQIR